MIIPAIQRNRVKNLYNKLKKVPEVFVKSNYVIRHLTQSPDISIGDNGDFGINIRTGKILLKQGFKWIDPEFLIKEKEILIPHTIYAASNNRPSLKRRSDPDPTRDTIEDIKWSTYRKGDIYTLETDNKVVSTTGTGSILSSQGFNFPVNNPTEIIFEEIIADNVDTYGIGIAVRGWWEDEENEIEDVDGIGTNVDHGVIDLPVKNFLLYTNDGKFKGQGETIDIEVPFTQNSKPGIEIFRDRIYFTKEEVVSSNIKYGRIYDHANAVGGTFFENYNLPTANDLQTLTNYITSEYAGGVSIVAANHLKSKRQVGSPLGGEWDTENHPRWDSDDTHYGLDSVGFNAVPAGITSGYFGEHMYIRSSTVSSELATQLRLTHNSGSPGYVGTSLNMHSSIRCFRVATIEEESLNDGTIVEIVKDYDDNTYEAIKIGTQIWLKQNVASTHYWNGVPVDYRAPADGSGGQLPEMVFTSDIVGTKRVRIGVIKQETTVGALIPPEEEGDPYTWEEIEKNVVQPAFTGIKDNWSIVLFKGSSGGTLEATIKGKVIIPSIWKENTTRLSESGTTIWSSTGMKNQWGELKRPWSVPIPLTRTHSSEAKPFSNLVQDITVIEGVSLPLLKETLTITVDGQEVFTVPESTMNYITLNGINYNEGVDYSITGTTLTWGDTELEPDDELLFYYQ